MQSSVCVGVCVCGCVGECVNGAVNAYDTIFYHEGTHRNNKYVTLSFITPRTKEEQTAAEVDLLPFTTYSIIYAMCIELRCI